MDDQKLKNFVLKAQARSEKAEATKIDNVSQ